MTGEAHIFTNSVGIVFRDTFVDEDGTVVDVSGATVAMRFRYPDDATTIDASPVPVFDTEAAGDGTDGKIKWTSGAAFFSAGGAGTWERQSKATLAGGAVLPGLIIPFTVLEPLAVPT